MKEIDFSIVGLCVWPDFQTTSTRHTIDLRQTGDSCSCLSWLMKMKNERVETTAHLKRQDFHLKSPFSYLFIQTNTGSVFSVQLYILAKEIMVCLAKKERLVM